MKKIYSVILLALMFLCFFRLDVHADIIIDQVRIDDVNWPLEGDAPDKDFTIHCYTKKFEIESSAVTIDWNNTSWIYYPFGVDRQPHDNNDALFGNGIQYGLRIYLKAAEGYQFRSATNPTDVYINDETEKLEIVQDLYKTNAFFSVKIFPPLAFDDPTIISSAAIRFDAEKLPREGVVINQSVYPFFTDPRIVLIRSSMQPWSQYFDGIGWSTCPKGSAFEIGRQYRLHLECIPINKGMVCSFDREFVPVIKGYPYDYIYAGSEHMAVNVYITCVEMNHVSMQLKPPKPGATTSYTTYSIPSDARYTASVKWVTNDASRTPVTQFQDGNEYRAIIRFTAKSGYHFGRYYAIDSDNNSIFKAELNGGDLVYQSQDIDNQWIEFSRVFSCGSLSKKAFNYLSISSATEPEIGKPVPADAGNPTVRTEHGIVNDSYNPITLHQPHTFYWYKNASGVKFSYQNDETFGNRPEGQGLTISYELNAEGGYTVIKDGFSAKVNGRDAECQVQVLGSKTYIIMTIDFADPITEESKLCDHKLQNVYTPATKTKEGYVEYVCSKCKECIRVTMVSKLGSIEIGNNKWVYNGSRYVPQIIVKNVYGVAVSADNYKVTCPTNLTDVGEHKVTVTCKNMYSGSASFVCTILPKSTTISKLKASKKKVKVTWKKQAKQISGYQIRYSKNSKFAKGNKIKTIAKPLVTSVVLSKLTSKKYYYMQIRTYKKVGAKTYFSTWSKTKKIKVK